MQIRTESRRGIEGVGVPARRFKAADRWLAVRHYWTMIGGTEADDTPARVKAVDLLGPLIYEVLRRWCTMLNGRCGVASWLAVAIGLVGRY